MVMMPIENPEAEHELIHVLAEQVRKTVIAEANAWIEYCRVQVEVAPKGEIDAKRQAWIIAGAEMNATFATALAVCEQIGAGWSSIAYARKAGIDWTKEE